MNMQELVGHVEAVIDKLEDQLTDDDKRCGWTEKHRTITKALFESLRKDVMDGKDVAKNPQYVTFIRVLDQWGISDGSLFAQTITVSNMVRKFVPDSSKI